MKTHISEIQITPIKPKGGLVGFASFVLNQCLYLGSIGIMTRPQGGYRLVYPTKKVSNRNLNTYYPINKLFAQEVEQAIIGHFEDVMNQSHDRHNSTHA